MPDPEKGLGQDPNEAFEGGEFPIDFELKPETPEKILEGARAHIASLRQMIVDLEDKRIQYENLLEKDPNNPNATEFKQKLDSVNKEIDIYGNELNRVENKAKAKIVENARKKEGKIEEE